MVAESGPDFLCVGAQKAGTAWLYDQLSAHPQVWMPPIKELHFFNHLHRSDWRFLAQARAMHSGERSKASKKFRYIFNDSPARKEADRAFLEHAVTYDPATSEFDWYAGLFVPKGDLLSGDITPAYSTLEEDVVKRIAARFPALKVIFLARDPIDRFWSQANMNFRRAQRKENAALVELTEWDAVRDYLGTPQVSGRSSPATALRTWRAFIPEDRFFVGFFDELVADPSQLRARICRFLEIEPPGGEDTLPAEFNRKDSHKKVPMSEEIRRKLIEYFHQEYVDTASLVGGPAQGWLARQLDHLEDGATTPAP